MRPFLLNSMLNGLNSFFIIHDFNVINFSLFGSLILRIFIPCLICTVFFDIKAPFESRILRVVFFKFDVYLPKATQTVHYLASGESI